jgi:high-affinity iron transporter
MITREGMETALLLLQLKDTLNLATGAILGVVSAAAVAALWTRFGRRVNLGLFFQVTAIFLFVFVIQLGDIRRPRDVRADYLPFSAPIHEATEPWGPDGPFRAYADLHAGAAAAAWLIFSGMFTRPRMEQHRGALVSDERCQASPRRRADLGRWAALWRHQWTSGHCD